MSKKSVLKTKLKIVKKSKKSKKSNISKKSNKSYNPNNDYFKTNARLNSSQRKYCHCLMSVRKKSKKISPYPICISFLKKKRLLDYSLKSNKYNYKKSKIKPPKVNPKITHCLMNYDLYKYDLNQIQHLALEKKIPIYYKSKSNKSNKSNKSKQKTKIKYFTKNTLISKIIDSYFYKNKIKSQNKSSSKKK